MDTNRAIISQLVSFTQRIARKANKGKMVDNVLTSQLQVSCNVTIQCLVIC